MTRAFPFPGAALAILALFVAAFGLASCSKPSSVIGAGAAWKVSGGDADGRCYSSLTGINDRNVDKLGYAWSYDMGTTRGQEATPTFAASRTPATASRQGPPSCIVGPNAPV